MGKAIVGRPINDISEKRAVELRWDDVCAIVSDKMEEILGVRIKYKINVVENSLWNVTFVGYRLPLPKLCQLLQATQATPEDWEDALPDEGGVDVSGIGTVLAEKLIGRHLHLTWKHHLITGDRLWLVGVSKDGFCRESFRASAASCKRTPTVGSELLCADARGCNMKKIWIRLGSVIEITDAEEQQIFGDDGSQMEETLRRVIAEGRFCPDGETYIPSEAVREFNRNYGTTHDEENWCCDL